MITFYFTSTGNSLAVAKRIGGTLISIPQVIDQSAIEYTDGVIGIVFPIYGFYCPKMVRRFLSKAKLTADYIFAIGTYGNLPGACMRNLQRDALKRGIHIDYAESLLMVDNYLPGFDVDDQIAKLPDKRVEENLSRVIADIRERRPKKAAASALQIAATAAIQAGEKAFMKATAAQSYIINDSCTRCGVCAKICPAGNIAVTDKVRFADKCEWCLGCIHLCPQNAAHLKNEKSAVRWRNPEVSLGEIVAANETKLLAD